MTTEAERIAAAYDVSQHKEVAALLRQQAAEIERLQSCGNGAGCLYKESVIESQAAEIERLKAELGVSRLAAITNKQASDLQKEIERLKSQLLEQVPAGMFIEYEEGCWEQMADNCKGATPLFHRKDYK